jgi:outer membrane receptor protein involved in Fe transport
MTRHVSLSIFLFTAFGAANVVADPDPAPEPEPETLTDEDLARLAEEQAEAEGEIIYLEDRAPAESASSVHFSKEDLRRRPHDSPSDLLRQVPGLVVAQHAGGGKSDQYFLRGFDADHGTDVALFLDGVPVNLTSHGHGQGYADSHWMIPETIASFDMHKGPYAARFGDFYTAGAIEMKTIDTVDNPEIRLSGGTTITGPVAGDRLDRRVVGLAGPKLGGGVGLLAVEVGDNDGPFIHPQKFKRTAALGKWKHPIGPGELTFSTTFYTADWNQSGQIPAAEVAAGNLNRFDAIDPSEGGTSTRGSVALGYALRDDSGGQWALRGYGVGYKLDLFSNFTLYLRDQVNGDQIEQTDERLMYGASGTYMKRLAAGSVDALVTTGVEARVDDVETGLYHAANRTRLADCFGVANPCNHTSSKIVDLAAYAEADVAIANKLHLLPGLRVDRFSWDVNDLDPETMGDPLMTTGGSASRAIVSPKLSALFHVSKELAVFANGGLGFHSNDARAAVKTNGPGSLARAYGVEGGARVSPFPGFRASADVWYLYLTSEQVWVGDNGGTEPSDPTRRYGVDVEASWDVTPNVSVDANVAIARSTVVANQGNGGALALAPRIMGGAGIAYHRGDETSVSLRARGVGQRPANDDGSLMAEGHLLFDLVAAQKLSKHFELGLTVVNLLDREWREAQFADASRVSPNAEELEDVHFTPGLPLTAMLELGMTY